MVGMHQNSWGALEEETNIEDGRDFMEIVHNMRKVLFGNAVKLEFLG